MKFYVRKSEKWQEVQVEINPTLTKALDTTNDSFSCILKATDDGKPYSPMTLFKVEYDDETEQVFVIQNDSVSIFSLNPKVYKHNLTVVQYRYVMHKQLVRNTVFNQPKIKNQKLYAALTSVHSLGPNDTSTYAICYYDGVNPVGWYDSVKINSHTKVKNATLIWKLFAEVRDNDANKYLEQMESLGQLYNYNAQLKNTVNFHIYDTKTNITIYTFYIDDYTLNTKTVQNEITAAINQYISQHGDANISLMYFIGNNNQGDSETMSFATAVDPSITLYNLANKVVLQCEIELELYNYTMFDVLNTLLQQNSLISSNYGSKREAPFYIKESGELYDLLTTTYPPETMTFTQATWFDVLTEIFKFYDAGFRFEFAEIITGPESTLPVFYLEIEYYNDRKNEITKDFSGLTINHSDKDFNNGKVAFYQNAVQKVSINSLNTRSTMLGVPQDSGYEIVLPKPIYDIEHLSMKINGSYDLFDSGNVTVNMNLDITPFVVSNEIWSVLDKNDDILYSINQRTTINFERGSKSINLSSYYRALFNIKNSFMESVITIAFNRFFGFSQQPNNLNPHFKASVGDALGTDWAAQKFNITYLTENNGRAEMETVVNKYRGSEIVNQNDGLIDLNKLGLNILGESLKNGEPTLTATYKITDWESVPKEGDYITYNNETWVVNIVNCKVVKDGYYQCTIEFSKNFNALSLRVHTDKEKRLTNISKSLAVMSEDNYIDYIYVDDQNANIPFETIPLDTNVLLDGLKDTFGYRDVGQNSYSFSLDVQTSEWTKYGGPVTLEVEVDRTKPIEMVIDNIRGGSYRTFGKSLAGVTLQSYSIANTIPGYNNTINFDNNYNAGQPLGIVGSFYGTIYFYNDDPSTEKTTITFTESGVASETFWVYRYYYDAQDFIGKNVSNITLSGFDGISKVNWNESIGYFYIYLRTTTQPTQTFNLTISFTYTTPNSKTVDVATLKVGSKNLYLPLTKYGFGNSICFEMQMEDSISAGNLLTVASGWFGSNKYFSQATPYTDDEGWADILTINFNYVTPTGQSMGIGNYPLLTDETTIQIEQQSVTLTLLEKLGSINNLRYYKKPNEIFALNYEWCFLPYNYNDFFIGSKFINENAFTMLEKMASKTYYLVYGGSEKYSILDIKGHGTNRMKANLIPTLTNQNKVNLAIIPAQLISNPISTNVWAIVDENNDIYFAGNTNSIFSNDSSNTKVITFTTRRSRL